MEDKQEKIAVIGGGIIGLSLGWQLARRGRQVTVFDRGTAGREASWVGAGMLAPHSEVGFESEDLMRLAIASLKCYPRFLDELAEDSGERVRLLERGTLIVGFDRDDTERIRRLFDFRQHLGLPVEWLVGSEARELEPLLSPKVTAAIWLPDDREINNRGVVDALKVALTKVGGELRENSPVAAVEIVDERVAGIVSGGETHRASIVVLCAGCWSRDIGGFPKNFYRLSARSRGSWLRCV